MRIIGSLRSNWPKQISLFIDISFDTMILYSPRFPHVFRGYFASVSFANSSLYDGCLHGHNRLTFYFPTYFLISFYSLQLLLSPSTLKYKWQPWNLLSQKWNGYTALKLTSLCILSLQVSQIHISSWIVLYFTPNLLLYQSSYCSCYNIYLSPFSSHIPGRHLWLPPLLNTLITNIITIIKIFPFQNLIGLFWTCPLSSIS